MKKVLILLLFISFSCSEDEGTRVVEPVVITDCYMVISLSNNDVYCNKSESITVIRNRDQSKYNDRSKRVCLDIKKIRYGDFSLGQIICDLRNTNNTLKFK
jgi:hypothetical protein